MRVIPIILVCFDVYSAAAQTGSERRSRGHVVNSVTGTPIAGANVVLAHEHAAVLWGHTDAGGVFEGRTSTGSHLLTVTRKGYRMTTSGMGKTVEVKPGAETGVTVEMLPLGVISGRI